MPQPPNTNGSLLALDVGAVRIGLALASPVARIAHPLTTLQHDDQFDDNLRRVIQKEAVSELVVGYPRGMDGQTTSQTKVIEEFVSRLRTIVNLPIHLQDESLTSVKAEQELKARGRIYQKADVDALAAAYILEDYLSSSESITNG